MCAGVCLCGGAGGAYTTCLYICLYSALRRSCIDNLVSFEHLSIFHQSFLLLKFPTHSVLKLQKIRTVDQHSPPHFLASTAHHGYTSVSRHSAATKTSSFSLQTSLREIKNQVSWDTVGKYSGDDIAKHVRPANTMWHKLLYSGFETCVGPST